MEESAIQIGLNLHYFWSLTPNQYFKHVRVYNQKEKERIKEQDYLNHILGSYISFAVNDPKHYPSTPRLQQNIQEPMSDDDMEKMARRNTIMMGGVIK